LKGVRKEGFSETVSARALIILLPILGSSAQEGINPHLSTSMFPLLVLGKDCGHLLGGGYVVAGGQVRRILVDVELLY
jgi:hypothetical protein